MEHKKQEILRSLLQRWSLGELTEREVHEEAERLWDQVQQPQQYPQDDPVSIWVEVVSNLSILGWQLIIPDDIPAMLTFLDTPSGRELEGWAKWQQYWKTIDFEKRRQSLAGNPYYAKSAVPVHTAENANGKGEGP